MVQTLTRRQLNRATLARQMLLARERCDAAEAVSRLYALQAQEPRPPHVALWTRLAGFRREHLYDALHSRTLVRATALRATLHLLHADDYAALRPVLQPMLTAALRGLGERAAGLDLDALLPVARDLLAERPRDFTALRALLQARFPEVNERALGYAVRLCLPLVMVPTPDRWGFPPAAEFTLADAWLDRPLSTDGSRAQVVLRYLAAFGPATATDAQAWLGLRGLREVLEELRPRLVVFRDERRRELFDLPDAPRPDPGTPAPARLLPEFDSLILAHADRTRMLADEHRGQVVTKNLRVRATFLWDGEVAGTWDVRRGTKAAGSGAPAAAASKAAAAKTAASKAVPEAAEDGAAGMRRTGGSAAVLRLRPFQPLPAAALDELREEGEALLRFAEDGPGRVEIAG